MGNNNNKGSIPHTSPLTPTQLDTLRNISKEEPWQSTSPAIVTQDTEEPPPFQFAVDIINEIVDKIPIKVEDPTARIDALEVFSDKCDSRSVSSADLTPSESSFDTAREDLPPALPDLLQPEALHEGHDRSDTEYESATDNEDPSSSFLSSPVEVADYCFNGQDSETTLIPAFSPERFNAIALGQFDREKTPVPVDERIAGAEDDYCPYFESSPNTTVRRRSGEDPPNLSALIDFDRERTPVVNDSGSFDSVEKFDTTRLLIDQSISFIEDPVISSISCAEVKVLDVLTEETVQDTWSNQQPCLNVDAGEGFQNYLNSTLQFESCDKTVIKEESVQLEKCIEDAFVCHLGSDVDAVNILNEQNNNVVDPVLKAQLAGEICIDLVKRVDELIVDKQSCLVDNYEDLKNKVNSVQSISEVDVCENVTPVSNLPFDEKQTEDLCLDNIVSVPADQISKAAFEPDQVEDNVFQTENGVRIEVESEEVVFQEAHTASSDNGSSEQFLNDSQVIGTVPAKDEYFVRCSTPAEQNSIVTDLVESAVKASCTSLFGELDNVDLQQDKSDRSIAVPEKHDAELQQEETSGALDSDAVSLQSIGLEEEFEQASSQEEENSSRQVQDSAVYSDSGCSLEEHLTSDVQSRDLPSQQAVPLPEVVDQDTLQKPEPLIVQESGCIVETDRAFEGDVDNACDKTVSVSHERSPADELEPTEECSAEAPNEAINTATVKPDGNAEATFADTNVESLDTSFGKVVWKSAVDQSLKETDCSFLSSDALKAAELEDVLHEQLSRDASLIAEELINLVLEEETQKDCQEMKDRMSDVENNEQCTSTGESPYDENTNPFESRRRLPRSPKPSVDNTNAQRWSAGVKNGDITPKSLPSVGKPLKKTTVSRNSPATVSPKRKARDSTGDDVEKKAVANESEQHVEALKKEDPVMAAETKCSDTCVDKPNVEVPCDVEAANTNGLHQEGDDAATLRDASFQFKRPLPASSSTNVAGIKAAASNRAESTDADVPSNPTMVKSVEGEMNRSEAGPDVAEVSDTEFRAASDVFKDPSAFEFLQMAGNKQLSESALARMSLYVKFDPLLKAISPVVKRNQQGANNGVRAGESDNDLIVMGSPPTNDVLSEASKCAEGRLLHLTPPRQTQESSPGGDGNRSSGRFYSEEEFSQALRMQELLFQEQLINKDREWDQKVKQQENEQQQLLGQLQRLHDGQQEMKKVVIEYEKTIAQLLGDREKEKQIANDNMNQLKKERDQALEDLQSVETAFGDLHRRYEKSKTALESFKKNEEVLRNYVTEGQTKLKKQEQKYELLKKHAEEKLESANQEIDGLRRTYEAEMTALRAQLKKAEMKIESLDRNLEQKIKENSELTNICDELIAQVGHGNS